MPIAMALAVAIRALVIHALLAPKLRVSRPALKDTLCVLPAAVKVLFG